MSLGQPEGAADSSASLPVALPLEGEFSFPLERESCSSVDSRSWSLSRCSDATILSALYLLPVLFYTFLAYWYKPGISVVWDSVYYKNLFFALTQDDHFDLKHYFPVSPLYPLSLVPSAAVHGYLQLAQIQVILGSVYYFTGIYPLYRLGCHLGGKRTGLLTALLFVIYPTSLYSSWIMSEVVSVPVFLFALWLSSEVMRKATVWTTLGLGVAVGLLPLSRPQGIFLAPVMLVLIPLMGNPGKREWQAPLCAGVLGTLLALSVWISLGYISRDGITLTYLDPAGERLTVLATVLKTLFYAAIHACGLWLEGGLLILPLGLLGGWWLLRARLRGDIARLSLSVAVISLFAVAFHIARFINNGELRPVLRYAFYCNLALLPFAAWMLLNMRLSPRFNLRFLCVSIVGLSAVLLWPHVLKDMLDLDRYFSNAPAIQVYTRLDGWPTVGVWSVVTLVGLAAATLIVRKPRLGPLLAVILVGVVTRHAVDHCLHVQGRALKHFGLEGVHALCGQLEQGEWGDVPVVCQYDPYVDFLGREIRFLTNIKGIWLAHEYDGHRPYLFVTFNILPDEQLVLNSGGLKAYLMTGPDKGLPPANYTPGPPPWY